MGQNTPMNLGFLTVLHEGNGYVGGYLVTNHIRAYVGYNFLYWTNVIRPGDQIDRVVDLTFVPNSIPVPFSGQNRPQPLFKQSDLWAQGLQFGLELRW